MTAKKKNFVGEKPFNENWEEEIAEYDKEAKRIEDEYLRQNVIITDSGSDKLTPDENEVITLYLNGVSCKDIAEQNEVEEEVVTGLLEIIKAKLSLED